MRIIKQTNDLIEMFGRTIDGTEETIKMRRFQPTQSWIIIRNNDIENHFEYRNDAIEWLDYNIWAKE